MSTFRESCLPARLLSLEKGSSAPASSVRSRAPWAGISLSVVLVILGKTRSQAQEVRYDLPNVAILACDEEGDLFLACDHDVSITAASFRMAYNPEVISVSGVEASGTSLDELLPEGPDFFSGTIRDGAIVWGIVFGGLDGSDPRDSAIPAGRHTLARIVYAPLAGADAETGLELADTFESEEGGIPGRNVVTTIAGESLAPELISGSVTILAGTLRAEVRAPDPPVLPGDRVSLDARETASACGGEPQFEWMQTGGPPAEDLEGLATPELSFVAPTVEGDTPLLFELTVTSGDEREVVSVELTVVDPEARRAELDLGSAQSTTVDLPGDDAKIGFAGRIAWDTPFENGVWRGLRFHAAGDPSALRALRSAAVFVDENGDNEIGPVDRELARIDSPVIDDDGTVLFSFQEELARGESASFALIVELDRGKDLAESPALAFFLFLGAASLLRRRGAKGRRATSPAVLSILLIPLLSLSCSGGGTDAATSSGGGTVRFSIESSADILLDGEETGIPAAIVGLPAAGPRIEV